MIYADAVIALPCACLVIPECVLLCAGVENAEGVGEAEMKELAPGLMRFGAEEGIALPVFGGVAIFIFGDDVEITADNEGCVVLCEGFKPCVQAFKPTELVIVFITGNRVSVGQVYIDKSHAVCFKFNIARLFVCVVTIQFFGDHGDGGFGKYGNAVIGLLPDSMRMIATEIIMREFNSFELLHHQDIGGEFGEVSLYVLFAGFD